MDRVEDEARRLAIERLIVGAKPQLGIDGATPAAGGFGGIRGIGGGDGPFGGIDQGPFGGGDPLAGVGDVIGQLLGGRRRGGPVWSVEGVLDTGSDRSGNGNSMPSVNPESDSPDYSIGEVGSSVEQAPKGVDLIPSAPGNADSLRSPSGPRGSNVVGNWWNSKSDAQKQSFVENGVLGAFQFAGLYYGVAAGLYVGAGVAAAGTAGSGGAATPGAIGAGVASGVAVGGVILAAATSVGTTAGKVVAASVLTPTPAPTPTPTTPTAPVPTPVPKPMQAPDDVGGGLGVSIGWNSPILEAKIRGIIGKRGDRFPIYDLPAFGADGELVQLGGLHGYEAFQRLILQRGPRVSSGWDYGAPQAKVDIPREMLYERIRQLIDPTLGGA